MHPAGIMALRVSCLRARFRSVPSIQQFPLRPRHADWWRQCDDTFVFSTGYGNNVITGFTAGSGTDEIDDRYAGLLSAQ